MRKSGLNPVIRFFVFFLFFYYHILSVYLIIGCVFVNSFVVEFWRSIKRLNNTSILKLLLN